LLPAEESHGSTSRPESEGSPTNPPESEGSPTDPLENEGSPKDPNVGGNDEENLDPCHDNEAGDVDNGDDGDEDNINQQEIEMRQSCLISDPKERREKFQKYRGYLKNWLSRIGTECGAWAVLYSRA
jgi:hypothetical protein